MLVCGFTIVRNAVRFGYPVIESIMSVLPLCDHFIVAVGDSDDGTGELIKSINSPKVSVIDTVWDISMRKGGEVLSVETNKALDAIGSNFDWCFYIQADEVVHEKDYPAIRKAMYDWKDNKNIDGLLFKYYHFWGTYDYIGVNRQWYRHEIRIVRNDKRIRSYRDAQGFRIGARKLRVNPVDAHIYHYGWVRPPSVMVDKMTNFSAFYHDEEQLKNVTRQLANFNYEEVDAVKRFTGTHPEVMGKAIRSISWDVAIDENRFRMRGRDKILFTIERITGHRFFEYKNYKIY